MHAFTVRYVALSYIRYAWKKVVEVASALLKNAMWFTFIQTASCGLYSRFTWLSFVFDLLCLRWE